MPKMAKSDRQAKRIPQSSGHKCRQRSSRKGRPNEYPKAQGTNAANAQVGREGPTNTKKFRAQMPQAVKSEGNAIRIPQSSGHKCLRRSSRKGRPHEYLKVSGTNAANAQVGREGHTNTKKLRAQMPPMLKSKRNAIRIPKSSRHKCLRWPSRTGRRNEYPKAPGTNASGAQVGREGHTNTKKLRALKSEGKAIRIPKSSGHKCLRWPSRKGRPYEYLKAPGTNASGAQVGREGPTNTKKLQAQMPQKDKSNRQAIYFLATSATAMIINAIPSISQNPKRVWKRRKAKTMDDRGSKAAMMDASAGLI